MKKFIWVALFFCAMTMLSGCTPEDDVSTASAKTAAEVLVPPVPADGEKVAEIDGCDYLYDQQYAFQFLYQYYPEEPTKEDIHDLVMYELFALEGQDLGLSFVETSETILQNRQETIGYFDDVIEYSESTLEEKGDALSGEEREDLQKKITSTEEQRENYKAILNSILEDEGISEEEFWQNQQPYIEKYLYAEAYLIKIHDDFEAENGEITEENNDAYMEYLDQNEETLQEKHNVKE